MTELISIIIPVYNVENYIDNCLESVVNQTYSNLEIILVNDGSTDNSINKCCEWEARDHRVVVYNKKNGGASAARNYGLDRVNGEYIMFIDSDDYIDKYMVEKLYSSLREEKGEVSMCDSVRVDNYNYNIKNSLKREILIWNEEMYWNNYYMFPEDKYIVLWNKLYSKKIFEDLRLPEGKLFEDELVMHKIIEKCSKVVYINEKLYYYFQRQGSSMNQLYTHRTFDAVEANTNRSIYFNLKGLNKLAEVSLTQNISRIIDIKTNLDMRDAQNLKRYKKEKERFTRAYFKLFKNMTIKSRLNILTFVMGERVYRITHTYKKIIKK